MLGADLDQISTDGLDLVLMILTAVICGVLLGYERQRKGKPVEILTASLVALGSPLFVLSGSLLAPIDNARIFSRDALDKEPDLICRLKLYTNARSVFTQRVRSCINFTR